MGRLVRNALVFAVLAVGLGSFALAQQPTPATGKQQELKRVAIKAGRLLDVRTGKALSAPADEDLAVFAVKVEGGDASWMFRLAATGGMDAWRLVDDNLWRLQRVRKELTPD